MSRWSNSDFAKLNKRLEKQLASALNERAERVGDIMIDKLVELFEHNARARLRSRATPKSASDAQLIENICNNIIHEEMGYYSSTSGGFSDKIKVLPDPENLYMFLEYGTGFRGWWHQNPDAQKAGWNYVTNPDHLVVKASGIGGWFFSYYGQNYLDKNDEYPNVVKVRYTQTTQMGGGFTDKNGRHVRRYRRRRNRSKSGELSTFEKEYIQTDYAFSTGLEAVRYFYDTKQEIRTVISELKGMDYSVKDMIEFLDSKKL